MTTLEKQTEALNEWLGLNDWDRETLIRNTRGQEWIDLKDIKQQIKTDRLLNELAVRRTNDYSKKLSNTLFYGSPDMSELEEDSFVKWFIKTFQQPPTPLERLPDPEFNGLSSRYIK